MRITILNGNSDALNVAFDQYLNQLVEVLAADRHEVTHLVLRDMDLRYCIGCFGCWVKTPGECVTADESAQVRRAVISADFVVWASPIRMGFISALLKQVMDKSIPLIHPYFVVDHNEAHHRPRYEHYPRLGLLLQRAADTDAEDIHLITDILGRTALNMKSRLEFAKFIDQPPAELARAITTAPHAASRFDEQLGATTGVQITPPTRLTVFNGSPRGRKGNTPILLEHFLKGFTAGGERSYELYHLNHLRDTERFTQRLCRRGLRAIGLSTVYRCDAGHGESLYRNARAVMRSGRQPADRVSGPIGFSRGRPLAACRTLLAETGGSLGQPVSRHDRQRRRRGNSDYAGQHDAQVV